MVIQDDSDWLVPQWPAPVGVQARCSTRCGGVSEPPYDGLNLGLHVGDAPEAVRANRAQLHERLGARPVFLDQVHGTNIVQIRHETPDACRADGAITGQTELACTVMVADCLPILLCDMQGRQVAALHAGWRGLVGVGGIGIVERGLEHFRQLAPVKTGDSAIEVIAWLGPCIGPRAFEVGDEVRAAFTDGDAQASAFFVAGASGKWWADLPGLARLRLHRQGVDAVYGNDGTDDWCTVNQRSRFFSHRRDGVSGRMAACIWLSSANRRA